MGSPGRSSRGVRPRCASTGYPFSSASRRFTCWNRSSRSRNPIPSGAFSRIPSSRDRARSASSRDRSAACLARSASSLAWYASSSSLARFERDPAPLGHAHEEAALGLVEPARLVERERERAEHPPAGAQREGGERPPPAVVPDRRHRGVGLLARLEPDGRTRGDGPAGREGTVEREPLEVRGVHGQVAEPEQAQVSPVRRHRVDDRRRGVHERDAPARSSWRRPPPACARPRARP